MPPLRRLLLPRNSRGHANPSTLNRVTQSISSQKRHRRSGGVEDMGGGYKGNFVLEGQFASDTGAQSGQDNRMWGRQAYAGLTTPFGEILRPTIRPDVLHLCLEHG